MATTNPSPTVTSQAATTITISAKICPSSLPHMRANATSARFAPFSISSRHSRITSGLRRVSTPPAPMQKIIAETTRYQPIAIALFVLAPRARADDLDFRLDLFLRLHDRAADAPGLGHRPRPRRARRADPALELLVGLEAATAPRQHDRADRGDQQQQRSDLEREQVLGQEQLADVPGRSETEDVRRALRR